MEFLRVLVKQNVFPEKPPNETISRGIEVAQSVGAVVEPHDISIAHRLPTRIGSTKPSIIKFLRRIAKFLMRKLKNDSRNEIYEYMTGPRAASLNLMNSKWGITAAWSKEDSSTTSGRGQSV